MNNDMDCGLGDTRTTAEWDDALLWLGRIELSSVRAFIFDPPYAVGTPVRGKEDGAAGSVFGPLSFMSEALRLCAEATMPGGVGLIFADWRRMPDLLYVASTVGLRPSTQVAWVRSRPGTGGIMRASWDPITIVARGVPDAIDRAAIRNVVEANYDTKRTHPYGKPPEVYEHILRRVVRPGDLVIDPFAGSCASRTAAHNCGAVWRGCDIDPAFSVPSRTDNVEEPT